MSVQRWCAVVLATAGVWLLAGPGWALLAAAGPVAVMAPPWAPAGRLAGEPAWTRLLGRVREFGRSAGRWASPGRLAVLALPAGLVATGAGAGVVFGPGAGVLAVGVLLLAAGVLLDRRAPDPAG